jgi:hypothetical protein
VPLTGGDPKPQAAEAEACAGVRSRPAYDRIVK